MDRERTAEDLFERLDRERQAADRQYNDALTALDRALTGRPELPSPPVFHDVSQVERLNQAWQILPGAAPAVDRSLKGRLRGFIWRVLGPTLEAQQRFNAALVDHVNRNVSARGGGGTSGRRARRRDAAGARGLRAASNGCCSSFCRP